RRRGPRRALPAGRRGRDPLLRESRPLPELFLAAGPPRELAADPSGHAQRPDARRPADRQLREGGGRDPRGARAEAPPGPPPPPPPPPAAPGRPDRPPPHRQPP